MKSILLLVLALVLFNIANAQSFVAGQTLPNGTFYDFVPDVNILGSLGENQVDGTVYKIDVNEDGILDFTFNAYKTPGSAAYTRYVKISPINNNEVAMYPQDTCFEINGDPTDIYSYYDFTYLFSNNDTINTIEGWKSQPSYLKYEHVSQGFYYCAGGEFSSNSNFIGLRIFSGTDTIYGWIKVKDITTFGSFTIEEFASSYNVLNSTNNKIDDSDETITVFPNPSNSIFTIEAKSMNMIEVMDISGRIVKTIESPHKVKQVIDLRKEAKGIYIIKIITDDRIKVMKVLIY